MPEASGLGVSLEGLREEIRALQLDPRLPQRRRWVVALFFGNGDFDETMHIIAMCGWNVDCNAAQIATVIATARNAPLDVKWTAPIGGRLDTYMRDIKQLSICELSKHTCEMARILNA